MNSVRGQHNSPRGIMSCGELRDFDYSIRLALSSDDLSSMRKPLLQLQLSAETSDGRRQTSTLEMSKEELDQVIDQLLKAQQAQAALN